MGISVWQLAIVLAIVLLLFGTKKLRNIGGDLGSAIRNFRGAVKESDDQADKSNDTVAAQLKQPADNAADASAAKAASTSADANTKTKV